MCILAGVQGRMEEILEALNQFPADYFHNVISDIFIIVTFTNIY